MSEKHRKILWFLAVLIFILFLLAVGWVVGVPMVRLADDPEAFRIWVDSHGGWGRIIFLGMVVLQVLVAFIPGEPVELAAGYAFGVWEGMFLTLLGFIIGSWIVFALVRRFGVRLVEVFFSRNRLAELKVLQNPKKTKVVAFLLMLIPGTPKDFLSYFAGLTRLKTSEWLTIVAVGRIPSLITSVVTGDAAGDENYLLSVGMLVLTLLISAVGVLYYRKLTKQEQNA